MDEHLNSVLLYVPFLLIESAVHKNKIIA